jgi:Ca2+-binding EF-hand superfamily protein
MRSLQLFSKLDANGDNSIDAAEIKSLTDYLGEKSGTTIDADALVKAIDSDGDGNISSTELTDNVQSLFDNLRGQLMSATQGAASAPPDADEMFAQIDTDGDGSISAVEFKAGMKNRPEGPPPGGHGGPPPAGDDSGRLLASLLEQYGTQSASATTSSTSLYAAA